VDTFKALARPACIGHVSTRLLSQRDRVINGLKLSHLSYLSRLRLDKKIFVCVAVKGIIHSVSL